MKLLKIALVTVLIISLSVSTFGAWAYRQLSAPTVHPHANEYVTIKRGASPQAIVEQLFQLGIVKNSLPLLTYIRFKNITLRAGEYQFPSPISPLDVLRKLQQGQERLTRFTVVEGWTRWDIADAIARLPELKDKDAASVLALMNDTTMIRELDPEAENLEGYLYPDTYSFSRNTTSSEMIATMVRRFLQVWNDEQRAAESPEEKRTVREIITIASLIETEAKLKAEQPLVSSVIYNRLARGMPLGIDSTLIYAAKLAGKWKNNGKIYQSDIDRVSPYNTRKQHGLPPGPVASPGIGALRAALNPSETDYIFYVRDPARNDGAHSFYNNESDFARGVQTLRNWEKGQAASDTNK